MDNKKHKVAIEVPYLALYNRLLSESSSGEDIANKIALVSSDRLDWETFLSAYRKEDRMEELITLSFPRVPESEDLAISLLIVSSSNTYFNIKKDVLFTASTVYTNAFLFRAVWEINDNEGKPSSSTMDKFDPLKSLNKEDFLKTINLISNGKSVIPVAKEITLLHGSFSRDTWQLLGSMITKPITTKSFGSETDGETKLLGTMTLIGDSTEALVGAVRHMKDHEVSHIRDDMAVIAESFAGDKDENNTKLLDTEDK